MTERACLLYLTYNSSADVDRLPSLLASAGADLPVLAVDNCSRDDSVAQLRGLGLEPEVTESNLGFTAGMNFALSRLVDHNASSAPDDRFEWVVIANPDIRAQEADWLLRLLDVPPTCGIVGARLTDGLQTLGGGVVDDGRLPLMRSRWRPASEGEVLCPELLGWSRVRQEVGGPTDFADEREVPWVAFALCALRLSMVERIGLLDEAYWHFVSDHEYCLRAWSYEWAVRYKPITFLHPSNTALQTAPAEAQLAVAGDIRRWCRVEEEYLRSSRWA